ncbi:NADH-ubiquinone oxidoreductase-F iron-sulfur binding region domain-containing protein [Fodinicola acaciae]|uniref:NADH-ubiquinone oxidoreductase-F iron-sulfur binding region domain-containing protein n=1 Tax=Fodinicola acaciae TaxID=2681555 RepID=UPI0013D2A38D|nr:NADH-ubiquinone oxidoreductase-F iron-sulfur binding region domain-containing protein [Fodinicola acaciae]
MTTTMPTRRLLTAGAENLAEHVRRNGPLPWQGGIGRLIPAIESAGLVGHGGAGFPAWRKLAAAATGERPVVIGNAAEGEPGSGKDLFLLRRAPHLVLDGLQLAAEAVGAQKAYLYAPAAADNLKTAIAERKEVDRHRVRLVTSPDRYLAGQETAAIAKISGRPALPTGRLTPGMLVHNVETLAHLALIARHGPAWFRRLGTPAEPGTFLATITGPLASPGVYEIPYGTPLIEVVDATRPKVPLQAVLVGGCHGGWLPMATARQTPLCNASLRRFGASVGAGVLTALPMSVCALREVARIVRYLAEEAAKQCGPCLNGLPALADAVELLANGYRHGDLVGRIDRLSALVTGRGACHHPDGTARLVHSSLRVFEKEIELHLVGRCSAYPPRIPVQRQP